MRLSRWTAVRLALGRRGARAVRPSEDAVFEPTQRLLDNSCAGVTREEARRGTAGERSVGPKQPEPGFLSVAQGLGGAHREPRQSCQANTLPRGQLILVRAIGADQPSDERDGLVWRHFRMHRVERGGRQPSAAPPTDRPGVRRKALATDYCPL